MKMKTHRYREPSFVVPFEHECRWALQPQTRLQNHRPLPPALVILARNPLSVPLVELDSAHSLSQHHAYVVSTPQFHGDILLQLECERAFVTGQTRPELPVILSRQRVA